MIKDNENQGNAITDATVEEIDIIIRNNPYPAWMNKVASQIVKNHILILQELQSPTMEVIMVATANLLMILSNLVCKLKISIPILLLK
jgi:hypothetical protein